MDCSAVVSGGEASKVLQFVEAAFDLVAFSVKRLFVAEGFPAAGVGGDDGLHAGGPDRFSDGVAIAGPVGDDRLAFHPFQHGLCSKALVHPTLRES